VKYIACRGQKIKSQKIKVDRRKHMYELLTTAEKNMWSKLGLFALEELKGKKCDANVTYLISYKSIYTWY